MLKTKQKELPKRKHIRLRGFDYSKPYAYFITVCSHNRRRYFVDSVLNQKILDLLLAEGKEHGFIIYAYCLMPDHLHLLLSPPGNGLSISEFIGRFKSKTTRFAWGFGIRGKLWHGRFYDHILRNRESLLEVTTYILYNPVRERLVDDLWGYRWSGGVLISSDKDKHCPSTYI